MKELSMWFLLQEDMSGSRTSLGDVHTTHPHFETYVELILSFSALRERRADGSALDSQLHQSFVSGYSIMVSNDNKTFSENRDFYVFNSECQWVDEVDGKFLFTLEVWKILIIPFYICDLIGENPAYGATNSAFLDQPFLLMYMNRTAFKLYGKQEISSADASM